MASSDNNRFVLDVQAIQFVLRAHDFFEKEKLAGKSQIDVAKSIEKTAFE